jgi:hypothetical protein
LMFFTAAMRRRISRWLATAQCPRPAVCGWLMRIGPITLDPSHVRARSRTPPRRMCTGLSVLDADFISGPNIASDAGLGIVGIIAMT